MISAWTDWRRERRGILTDQTGERGQRSSGFVNYKFVILLKTICYISSFNLYPVAVGLCGSEIVCCRCLFLLPTDTLSNRHCLFAIYYR